MQTATANNLVLIASDYPEVLQKQIVQNVAELGYGILPADIDAFKSKERFCELYPKQQHLFVQNKAEIENSHVHIVMSMSDDPSVFFYDAINTLETVKRYNPLDIHLIMPFAPFARQDRAFENRFCSQMGDTFPKHLKFAGADYISTFDMHSKASEQSYIDHFGAGNVRFLTLAGDISPVVKSLLEPIDEIVATSPDGADKPNDLGQIRAGDFNKRLGSTGETPKIWKAHEGNETKVTKFVGDVAGKTVVEYDDIADTGGTLVNAAEVLKENGAEEVMAAFPHAVLSGNTLSRLTGDEIDGRANPIDFLVASDSITGIYAKRAALSEKQQERVKIVSTAPLIKEALTYKFS